MWIGGDEHWGRVGWMSVGEGGSSYRVLRFVSFFEVGTAKLTCFR